MTTTDEPTTTDRPTKYADARTQRVTAGKAIGYAYRDLGEGGEGDVPLVLLQHFRGNLDNWDPALAADRRVVCFDNVGVGATTGTTPSTVEAMAHGAIAFVEAMGFPRVDLLGFSIGSFVAQEIALIRPDLLGRVASTKARRSVTEVAGCGAARAVLHPRHRCRSSATDTAGPTWIGDLNLMTHSAQRSEGRQAAAAVDVAARIVRPSLHQNCRTAHVHICRSAWAEFCAR